MSKFTSELPRRGGVGKVTVATATINARNRMAIGLRAAHPARAAMLA